MRNITLISTVHEEEGVCNASTLHEILERARPDVIFVEVAPSSFERYLKEKSEWNLETYAVNRYLETHSAAVEPVDLCDAPNDLIAAYGRLHREVRARSPEYSRLKYQDSQHIAQYGFAYLNSRLPGGHLKLPHLWPGQTPPPPATRQSDFIRLSRAWQCARQPPLSASSCPRT